MKTRRVGRALAVLLLLMLCLGLSACAEGSADETPAAAETGSMPAEREAGTGGADSGEGDPAEEPETEQSGEEEENSMKRNEAKENQIRITVGESSFIVTLEDNESAAALRELLLDGDRTISASNYGGFEKVCQLGTRLPSHDVQTTTQAGDVMLYNSNQIVIFYASNSWAYTRLGRVEGLSAGELEAILSGSESEITLSIH